MKPLQFRGPYKTAVKEKGPYSTKLGGPEAWYYRKRNRIELHLQADGRAGLMHYIVKIGRP